MRTKLWTFALLSLFVAACSKNDTTDNPLADGPVPAEINASITDAITTRMSGTVWNAGDCIGISDDQPNYHNVPYTFNGQSFQPNEQGIYFESPKTVTFSAYYPYNDAGGILTATTDADNQNSQIDFLFASGATADIQNPQVDFTNKNAAGETDPTMDHSFRHCMSQISLTFKEGVEVDFETEGITEFSFTNLKLDGSFNTATGEAKADEGATVSPLTIDLSGATVTDGKVSSSVICFPQEVSEIELSVIVNGVDYHASLTLPDADQDGIPDLALLPGCNYTYNIIVDKTALQPGACAIQAWNDAGRYQDEATNLGYYYDKETNTYLVYNADGLNAWAKAVQNDMTLNCEINNTITLPEVSDGESNWTPIGSEDNPYRGRFTGLDFGIKNLTIYLPEQDYVGMFRVLHEESQVEILLQNAKIIGKNYVGAIAGSNRGAIFSIAMGSVSGAQYVGGLTGINNYRIELNNIYQTYTQELRVSGTDYVGGIAGYNTNGNSNINVNRELTLPFNVSGDQYVGGAVGFTTDTLRNIYINQGTIQGKKYVGGIVGYNNNYRKAILASSSGCTVQSEGEYAGGIAGASEGDIIACFSTGDVSGTECVGGIVGQNNATYPDPNKDYPTNSKIYACYTTGAVSGTRMVGSISGHNLCQVTSCYYTQGDTPIGLNEGATYGNAKVTDWNLVTRKLNDNIPVWEKFRIEYHNDTELRTPPYVIYVIRY